LDAYTSLQIWLAISQVPIPVPLSASGQDGIKVLLFQKDMSHAIAYGHLSPSTTSTLNGFKTVTVTVVFVPGALVENNKQLKDFGPVPFQIPWKHSQICVGPPTMSSLLNKSLHSDMVPLLHEHSNTIATIGSDLSHNPTSDEEMLGVLLKMVPWEIFQLLQIQNSLLPMLKLMRLHLDLHRAFQVQL
jgi:hypothetical protein